MTDQSKAGIIALIIAIGFVGFLIIGRNKNDSGKAPGPGSNQSSSGANGAAKASAKNENTKLLADLQATDPGSNGTPAQLKTFYDLVASKAKSASALEISECLGNPPVMSVSAKKNFTITNSDAAAHVISHPRFTFDISAKSQTNIAEVAEVGIYGYSCDGKNLGGYFFVTP